MVIPMAAAGAAIAKKEMTKQALGTAASKVTEQGASKTAVPQPTAAANKPPAPKLSEMGSQLSCIGSKITLLSRTPSSAGAALKDSVGQGLTLLKDLKAGTAALKDVTTEGFKAAKGMKEDLQDTGQKMKKGMRSPL